MVKVHAQQSIWPVSVFGLGFMLIIMGLSGVASIQETRRIHQQILSVEDSYRHIENLVEGIRSDTSNADILRRDRLLDSSAAARDYMRRLAGLRSKTTVDLNKLRPLRPQPESKVFERLETSLQGLLGSCGRGISRESAQKQNSFGPGPVRHPKQEDIRCDGRNWEAERGKFRIAAPGIEPRC